jgi:AcrR family transcriptional regulator
MTSRMKGPDRRAAIVDAAIHLFAEKGFHGATTRGLAHALGVTEPILYQHFATKSELYSAIIEVKSREGLRRWSGWAPLPETDDDQGLFSNLAGLILQNYEEDPDFMRLLLFSALERHELADLFYDRQMQQFYDGVAAYIQRRIDAGAFRAVDPEIASRGFIGMVAYHGLLRLLFRKRVPAPDRAKVVEQLVETFLRGMRPD